MDALLRFFSYYVRSALPFISGLAFGIWQGHLNLSLPLAVGLGMVLVVAGPLVIQIVLTLLAEALRGAPGDSTVSAATGAPALRFGAGRHESGIRRR